MNCKLILLRDTIAVYPITMWKDAAILKVTVATVLYKLLTTQMLLSRYNILKLSNNSSALDNGQGELTSNSLKIQHTATADTQPSVHIHTGVWTQTDCTVTQTSLCRRKLWEGHPWEVSRPSVLYASGKTGNLITAKFVCTCVQFAVSSYELVLGYMVLYTVTVRM
jgi:hypothetical protein